MSDGYSIKQIQPVVGDWFCVTNFDRDRWFIERIVALGRRRKNLHHEIGSRETHLVGAEFIDHFLAKETDVGLVVVARQGHEHLFDCGPSQFAAPYVVGK